MRTKARIEIPTAAPRTARVFVGDKEVKGIRSFVLNADVRTGTELVLTMLLGEVAVDHGAVEVKVDDKTRKTLLALGWLPPERAAEVAALPEYWDAIREANDEAAGQQHNNEREQCVDECHVASTAHMAGRAAAMLRRALSGPQPIKVAEGVAP